MIDQQLLYAYLAGIVDGEGSISIKSESMGKPYVGYLTVTNCNYEMIKLFECEFGGKVRKRNWSNNQKNISKNWKPSYEWSLTKQQAAKALRLLFPYLRIKSRQATLVLRLARLKSMNKGTNARWRPDLHTRFIKLYDKIKTECVGLNKRGL